MHSLTHLCAAAIFSFVPILAFAQSPQAPTDTQRWQGVFKAIAEENQPRLMVGDIDGYVAAVRKAVKADDWVSQTVAGDALYRVSPAAAIPFHEAAAKLAPDEGLPQLELGFDYQRTGQCDRAIVAWQAADKRGALANSTAAVAAYCFFRAGRVDEALALWARVPWPRQRVPVDFALSEMVMGTRALNIHSKSYVQARAGDEKALKMLITNALDWRTDWWNASMNRQAFDVVRALVKNTRPNDTLLQRELDCASDAGAAKDADTVKGVMRRCHFWIEEGELPASSEVAKFLLARLDAVNAAPAADLLKRFGTPLATRARSNEGDLVALETLAYLQVMAHDQTGLKATDELGWHRYRLAQFATSRVAGAAADEAEWSAHGEALLKEALVDFPDQALLHRFRYEFFPPKPSELERYLLEWVVAEYAGLTANMKVGGLPTSTTLSSLTFTVRKRREEQATLPKS